MTDRDKALGPSPMDLIERLEELRLFLAGEGELDGHSFGDLRPVTRTRSGAFWWRRAMNARLSATSLALSQAQGRIGDLEMSRPPRSIWRGACGHLWDRAREDTADCPRCAAEGLLKEAGEVANSVIEASNGKFMDGSDADALDALAEKARSLLSKLSPGEGGVQM